MAFTCSNMQRGPTIWVSAIDLNLSLLRIERLDYVNYAQLISYLCCSPKLPSDILDLRGNLLSLSLLKILSFILLSIIPCWLLIISCCIVVRAVWIVASLEIILRLIYLKSSLCLIWDAFFLVVNKKFVHLIHLVRRCNHILRWLYLIGILVGTPLPLTWAYAFLS